MNGGGLVSSRLRPVCAKFGTNKKGENLFLFPPLDTAAKYTGMKKEPRPLGAGKLCQWGREGGARLGKPFFSRPRVGISE